MNWISEGKIKKGNAMRCYGYSSSLVTYGHDNDSLLS